MFPAFMFKHKIHNFLRNITNCILYIFLSLTFNTVPEIKRTGEVVFYWLIDIGQTNQCSCIMYDIHVL